MNNEIKWSIDQAHSEIAFKIRHLMIASIKGKFKTFDANIYTTGKDFKTAVIDLWIDPSSIDTGNQQRDAHLKTVDFLNVENYKQISFTSSTIGELDVDGTHKLWGELTLNGITKNLELDVSFSGTAIDPWGNEKAGFAIVGVIKRSEWGIIWNTAMEAGGFMLGDEITIVCEIELTNMGQKDLTMELEKADEKMY